MSNDPSATADFDMGTHPMPRAKPPAVTEEEETVGSRRMDPELRVIGSIIRQFDELDPPTRRRVMEYLYARFAAKE